MFAPGFDSERLTRLCGTGVPFRPLFCPIPSCNVPGLKNSFQPRPRYTCGRPRRERNSPDKQRSIRKKTCSVKLSSKRARGKSGQNWHFGPALTCKIQDLRVNRATASSATPIFRDLPISLVITITCGSSRASGGPGYHGAITRR